MDKWQCSIELLMLWRNFSRGSSRSLDWHTLAVTRIKEKEQTGWWVNGHYPSLNSNRNLSWVFRTFSNKSTLYGLSFRIMYTDMQSPIGNPEWNIKKVTSSNETSESMIIMIKGYEAGSYFNSNTPIEHHSLLTGHVSMTTDQSFFCTQCYCQYLVLHWSSCAVR